MAVGLTVSKIGRDQSRTGQVSIESQAQCPYQKVRRIWRYAHYFRYNTRVWRTDRQTDGWTDVRIC